MTDNPNPEKELPEKKLDRLIKLVRMTESQADAEVVMAMRSATALLKSEGWDWDRLLRGKVKIIANPFAGATPLPNVGGVDISQPVRAPMRPVRQPFASTTNPRPQPQTSPQQPTVIVNKYDGECDYCHNTVLAHTGWAVKPALTNIWDLYCHGCARNRGFVDSSMPRPQPPQPAAPPPYAKDVGQDPEERKRINGFFNKLLMVLLPNPIENEIKRIESMWRKHNALSYSDYAYLKAQAGKKHQKI